MSWWRPEECRECGSIIEQGSVSSAQSSRTGEQCLQGGFEEVSQHLKELVRVMGTPEGIPMDTPETPDRMEVGGFFPPNPPVSGPGMVGPTGTAAVPGVGVPGGTLPSVSMSAAPPSGPPMHAAPPSGPPMPAAPASGHPMHAGASPGRPCGSAMLNAGVVPVFKWLPSPETIPVGALAEPPGFSVVSGKVLGLIGTVPLIFARSDLKKISSQTLTTNQYRSFTDHSNPS